MVFIYTLKLIQGKYYVGKTNNSSFRLDNYFNLNSSALKYKPIELLELIPNSDDSFGLIELDKTRIQHLTQPSNGKDDKYFICSKVGPIKFSKYIYDSWCCEKCNKNFDNKKQCETHEQLCKDEWVYEEDEYYDDDNIDSNICCF
jgi:hypothetical protein